ncbi:hypothetical protein C2G38_2227269 [Gigaspora rosea]|uniref:Uncharacterized protein n=1 Tax=Gigaspora rosea TaxID=44941 RepID=A0A397TXK7_9GLOM|nr:hypothetical protein C2G38_2227269 [Gigaspora rosea]
MYPTYHEYLYENPEKFIDSFYSYLVAAGIIIAGRHANKVCVHGLFETCLKGRVKCYYEGVHNVIYGCPLGTQALNRANGQAGNAIILAHIVFEKDWSYANRRPTDHLPNASNANTGATVAVVGIMLDELLPKFEEIERFTVEQLSGAYLHSNSDSISSKKACEKDNYSGMTETKNNLKNDVSNEELSELFELTKKQLKIHVAKAIKKTVKTQQWCSNCIDSNSDSNTSSSDSFNSDTSLENFSDSENDIIDITINIAKSKKKLFVKSSKEKIESQSNTSLITEVVLLDPDREEYLNSLMEIDFIKKKEPKTSIATIKCKSRHLKIPTMTVDFKAEPPIITENIIERVGAKIDKSKIHDFSSISRVVNEKTNKLKISLNGKDYIILVTMHKVKNKLEDGLKARHFSDSRIASSDSIQSFSIEAIRLCEMSSGEFWLEL